MDSEEPPNTITTSVVILVFIVIVIIAGVSSLLITPDSFDSTRWRVFVITLASLSIVMTFMFYYAIIELQLAQVFSQDTEECTTVSETTKKVVKHIADASETVPCFVSSLSIETDECSENSVRQMATKSAISYDIFSLWSMALTRKSGNDIGYVRLFLQWAKSSELRRQWELQRHFFTRKTNLLGDMLFEGYSAEEIVSRTREGH